jgi:hypothetical protein
VKVAEEVNARAKLGRKEALALAGKAKKLVAAKGTKLQELALGSGAKSSEILALMLGPTGNLRAPVMVVGSTLYVGFPKGGFPGLK